MSGTGIWAYAITEQTEAVDLSWLSGVGGAKVRTAACSELTMLVSDVSLAEFGEAALRRNLENLDWLDEVARAHHHVIEAAGRLFPVLPTRLATIYSSDEAVCAALAERRAQLRAALDRVGGRLEWGVKAYAAPEAEQAADAPAADAPAAGETAAEDAAAGEAAAEDAAAGDAQTGSKRTGVGLAYLKRRRAQLTAGRESRLAAVNGARAVHAELATYAEDVRLHPAQSAELTGVRLPMLLNAAYLLGANDGTSFAAAVAAEATTHPELRIELTGPWPPYSFAGDEDDGH